MHARLARGGAHSLSSNDRDVNHVDNANHIVIDDERCAGVNHVDAHDEYFDSSRRFSQS